MATVNKKQNDFGTGSIPALITRMSLPMMVAQLVNILYNVVDRIYISNIPQVGSLALAGVIIAGLGCAPMYPNIVQDTPRNFGAENSQAVIGVQMAFAYCGSLFMPTVFAFIAERVGYGVMPVFELVMLGLMLVLFNMQAKIVDNRN